jgi:hypothetical protein
MGSRFKPLAELEREYAEQTAEWERVRTELRQVADEVIAEHGDEARIAVPQPWVTEIDAAPLPPSLPFLPFPPRARG